MHYQFEENPIDGSKRLQREIDETKLEAKIETQIQLIQDEIELLIHNELENQKISFSSMQSFNDFQKNSIFQKIIHVLQDVRLLEGKISAHPGGVYSEQKFDEIFKHEKLISYEEKISIILKNLEKLGTNISFLKE
jgi:hypothetical protein